MTLRIAAALVLLPAVLFLSLPAFSLPAEEPAQAPETGQPSEQPAAEPVPPGEPVLFEPAPEPGIPDGYLEGKGYMGNFQGAWGTDTLFDPINAKVFLALQDGAGRQALSHLEVPDLDMALWDLTLARMVRESEGIYRPAFPLIREEERKGFEESVEAAANRAYARLLPALKKIRKAADGEKILPWLYALLWAEVLESRTAEQALVRAGALDAQRLRDEGYFWALVPKDPFTTGDERYSTGRWTIHYLWSPVSYPNPAIQNIAMRRRILEDAVGRLPWDDARTQQIAEGFGILDDEKHVRVPVLRKDSRLLALLRKASRRYAKDMLRALKTETLEQALKISHDEAFAAGFACAGYRVLEKAVSENLVPRPDYLANSNTPFSDLVETLVITEDQDADPLHRAYYLYDQKDFSGAIRQADAFLRDHPGDSEALFRKGMALMKLRKYPEALEVFELAAERPVRREDVWRGWILIRIGNILDMMGRREEALMRYGDALGYANVFGSHGFARRWMENIYQD